MSNLFRKIKQGHESTVLQSVSDGQIVGKKKAGRPPRPGIGRYALRLPIKLHRRIRAYCDENGLGFSQFIQYLVLAKLEEE